jgi:hypothetical protein
MKAAQDAEIVLLEGLGNNIIENIGNVELGKSLRVFIRTGTNKIVGGAIANCISGWMYISLLWIEKSL